MAKLNNKKQLISKPFLKLVDYLCLNFVCKVCMKIVYSFGYIFTLQLIDFVSNIVSKLQKTKSHKSKKVKL